MATAQEVISAIASGALDDQLDGLLSAIRSRRKFMASMQAAENQATLFPGTRVRITGNISPKYLLGEVGTVSSLPPRRAGDIQVDMERRVGRFGGSLGVPANCLERI